MAELENSMILRILLERSKRLMRDGARIISAERFLVALINEIKKGIANEEIAEAAKLFREYGIDIERLRDGLIGFLHREVQDNEDEDFMSQKLRTARSVAEFRGDKELTISSVLTCILVSPTLIIRELLGEAQSAFEPEDFDSMPFEEEKEEKKPEPTIKEKMGSLISEVKRVREDLKKNIFGQDKAIDIFMSGYFQASLLSMIDKTKERPRATFLFAGPPGVGKTFLAQKAADALGLPLTRFDMSEYCDKEASLEFCGSDAVYKNSKGGNFTTCIKEHPNGIILLDEIEKAHISIIHLFLQVLDAGHIRDSKTDEVLSLKNNILIFTTNAGKQLYNAGEERDLSSLSRKVIIDALEKDVNPNTNVPYFPAAICSRFASGNVVMFNHISAHDLHYIAKKEISRHAENLQKEMGIQMKLDERVYTALLLSEGVKADARTTRSRAEAFFNDELYELFRLISSDRVKTDIQNIEKIKVEMELAKTPQEIASLFETGETKQVLVIAGQELIDLCQSQTEKCAFHGVQSLEAAKVILQSGSIDMVLLDMQYGVPKGARPSLNIEDVDSPARKLLGFLREQKSEIPIYLLQEDTCRLQEEEIISFTRQGIRGVLEISRTNKEFVKQIELIAAALHQQASMLKLGRENKLLSFETAQSISADGKVAKIKLFDFKMAVAVDSEDMGSVISAVSRPNIYFEDVIGAKDAKRELSYFVEYLKNPKKYMGTGVKAPRGVLLYGPPGTGKTMLAKALAREADVTFIAAEGNQFLKSHVGEGSEKVHEIFRTARKYAPTILFIDEIDAIARERAGLSGSGAESEATLTTFLAEMDGFSSNPSKPVFVLAATNFDVEPGRPKSLDPALMRRFDRRIYVDLPDNEERARFLKKKIEKNPSLEISEGQVEQMALRSVGMSLADLDSVVELALRSAIREGSVKVTGGILAEAFEVFTGGEAKAWDRNQLERVARHEAGHALLCWLGGEEPAYISVVARGNRGGYVQHSPQEGKGIYTKEELNGRIRSALGGRAAEIVYYGDTDGLTTSVGSDLANATNLARHMVCSYGMEKDFGMAVLDHSSAEGAVSAEMREVVNRILEEQMSEAVRLISENRERMDLLVETLMVRNHLNGPEITEIFNKKKEG